MPDYSLNWIMGSSAIQGFQRCQCCSSPTWRWPSRSWKPFTSSLPWNIDRSACMPDSEPYVSFLLLGKNLPGNITTRTPVLFLVVTLLSAPPPTHCTWSCFLLACHPRNFWGISTENSCVLFTLGTAAFPVFSFNKNSTSAGALTDIKEVFKSISNKNTKT